MDRGLAGSLGGELLAAHLLSLGRRRAVRRKPSVEHLLQLVRLGLLQHRPHQHDVSRQILLALLLCGLGCRFRGRFLVRVVAVRAAGRRRGIVRCQVDRGALAEAAAICASSSPRTARCSPCGRMRTRSAGPRRCSRHTAPACTRLLLSSHLRDAAMCNSCSPLCRMRRTRRTQGSPRRHTRHRTRVHSPRGSRRGPSFPCSS